MKLTFLSTILMSAGMGSGGGYAPNNESVADVRFHYEQVDAVNVFYREAGPKDAPTILMLHGFAASSFMWRDLIDGLSNEYHIVAIDLPGFGFTETPERGDYDYTFANITDTVDKFLTKKEIDSYTLVVHDYGAPVGWRLALKHPDQVTAIISQNGNAYVEGLAKGWDPIKRYWENPNEANRQALSDFPTPQSIRWQYEEGVADVTRISPDGYTLEGAKILEAGMADIQLDLLLNYATNVNQYPDYQKYFREYQPPLLAVWGKNDPFFLPEGATAWKRDIPSAEVHFYDTGHFALESHSSEIIPVIKQFLRKNLGQ